MRVRRHESWRVVKQTFLSPLLGPRCQILIPDRDRQYWHSSMQEPIESHVARSPGSTQCLYSGYSHNHASSSITTKIDKTTSTTEKRLNEYNGRPSGYRKHLQLVSPLHLWRVNDHGLAFLSSYRECYADIGDMLARKDMSGVPAR